MRCHEAREGSKDFILGRLRPEKLKIKSVWPGDLRGPREPQEVREGSKDVVVGRLVPQKLKTKSVWRWGGPQGARGGGREEEEEVPCGSDPTLGRLHTGSRPRPDSANHVYSFMLKHYDAHAA